MNGPSPTARPCRTDEQMSCKVCGVVLEYDFHVPDVFWLGIVPDHLRDHVLCAGCFHGFALAAGVSRWTADRPADPRIAPLFTVRPEGA